MKRNPIQPLKLAVSLIICLHISCIVFAQATFQTTPMSGANTTGSYYHHSSITLQPGFSTTPGGSFHAYIAGSSANCLALGTSATASKNYIISYTVRERGLLNPANTSLTSCQVNPVIQYFDGLGRPLQTVKVKASPGGKDIVQHMEYDLLGRDAKKHLPYAETTSADGSFKSSAVSNQNSFYNSLTAGVVQIPVTSGVTPSYAQSVYELSPLNRVIEQGAPGAAWQPSSSGISGSGHTVQTGYGVNASGEITLWQMSGSAEAAGSATYPAGRLTRVSVADEDGNVSIEFKDMEGRVVAKQAEKPGGGYVTTHYVYDDLGNLRYVIPPGFSPTSFVEDDVPFTNFIYAYEYDGRRRVIRKKMPGKGWEEMIYNKLDQLVLSRDQVLAGSSQWLYTKYDRLGRVVVTGLTTNSSSASSIRSTVDAQLALWEVRSGSGTGYTDNIFPTANLEPHTINYYDDYSFYNNTFSPSGSVSSNTRGLLTGSRVNVLGGSTMLLTTNYYDEEGRVKESKSENHLGGSDLVVNTWSFAGELTASIRTHTANSVTTTIANNWEYDHVGRKLNTKQNTGTSVSPETEVLLSSNAYNEIGQLSNKTLHNGTQATAYTYNERNWLKTSSSTEFSMELKYQDAINSMTPQYNGNIANQLCLPQFV